MDKRRLRKLLNKYAPQVVEPGEMTIYVGFKRKVAKVFELLKHHTAHTVILRDVPELGNIDTLGVGGVKTLIIENAGRLLCGALFGMDDLETLIIRGTVGYINPMAISNCNHLRRIEISANIFMSDGYLAVGSCPELRQIIMRGVLPKNFVHVTDDYMSYFKNFRQKDKSKFPFENYRDTFDELPAERQEQIRENLHATARFVNKFYERDKQIDLCIGHGGADMWKFFCRAFGSWKHAYKIRRIGWSYGLERKIPTVATLKLSAPYKKDENDAARIKFSYAEESNGIFGYYRRAYHLRKVSGKGSDIDKMVRLCRWVHDSIRHSGSSIPETHYNLSSLMHATRDKDAPGNCWILAMCLNEALLSIGIKSRYIKGFQKWDEARNYHVFVAAWSRQKRKWIFLDPTYGCYLCDEAGEYLSPAEVRHRLINDLPLVLNEDADYNGDRSYATTYLSSYLAPNMYYMMTNTLSQHETEGPSWHSQGTWVTLVPSGRNERVFIGRTTTDEELFWQAPEL